MLVSSLETACSCQQSHFSGASRFLSAPSPTYVSFTDVLKPKLSVERARSRTGELRVDSVVRSQYCFCRGPKLNRQHPHWTVHNQGTYRFLASVGTALMWRHPRRYTHAHNSENNKINILFFKNRRVQDSEPGYRDNFHFIKDHAAPTPQVEIPCHRHFTDLLEAL